MKDMSRTELLEILNALLDENLSWFELRTPTAYIRIGDGPRMPNPAPLIDATHKDGPVATAVQTNGIPAIAELVGNPAAGSTTTPVVAAAPAEAPKKTPAPPASNGHSVTAPFAGVFYRRSSPTEPPFVEVGARVGATDIVCLVEVMKLFNSVQAGIDGVVIAIDVEDGEIVEYGQLLMHIAPEVS